MSSSELGSSSELASEVSDVLDDVEPRKRRRLSPIEDGSSSDTAEAPFHRVAAQQPNLPARTTAAPSRINKSTNNRSLGDNIESRSNAIAYETVSNGTLPLETSPSAPSNLKVPTFSNLGIPRALLATLKSLAINHPTPIQTHSIPPILAGSSVIGSSATGSGKTLAFALPILSQLSRDPSAIFALVLTPTRELALQIYEQFLALGSSVSGLKCALVTGGADMRAQALELARRPHVVIATPGRLADHVKSSGTESTGGFARVKFVVLDEADRLLAGGRGSMLPDVGECLSVVPPKEKRQTLLFSATVTAEVTALRGMSEGKVEMIEIANDGRRLHDGEQMEGRERETAVQIPETLDQRYILAPVTQKESYLHVFLLTPRNEAKSAIVFVNRTDTATHLEHMLRLLGHRVTSLHSGLQQATRTANLARFRARAARILVTTDVASRGLDIQSVDLVVNYDVPRDPDTYVHRVGRTARAGRKGTSVTMVGQRDVELVLAIEERTGVGAGKMAEYAEEGVSIEGRVVRDALKVVGEASREARVRIDEGREVTGRRKRPTLKMR